VRYAAAAELQEALRARILAGSVEDTLLLCEHEPVVTLGRSADPDHVLVALDELARRGIECCRSSRGGDVTYHGPGQLVGYPVVRVRGALDHVVMMADAIGDCLHPLGIRGGFRRDAPGFWVEGQKLAAFGVHIRRRVAIHGFALNVAVPLAAFSLIVPCGLAQACTTSLHLLGVAKSVPELAEPLARAFAARRGSSLEPVDAGAIL
jgi:lipoate-protein ligase B